MADPSLAGEFRAFVDEVSEALAEVVDAVAPDRPERPEKVGNSWSGDQRRRVAGPRDSGSPRAAPVPAGQSSVTEADAHSERLASFHHFILNYLDLEGRLAEEPD